MKLDRKSIDLQTFLDNLDYSDLNNMAPEALGFDDEDEYNEEPAVGKKRHSGGSAELEKQEPISSLLKNKKESKKLKYKKKEGSAPITEGSKS